MAIRILAVQWGLRHKHPDAQIMFRRLPDLARGLIAALRNHCGRRDGAGTDELKVVIVADGIPITKGRDMRRAVPEEMRCVQPLVRRFSAIEFVLRGDIATNGAFKRGLADAFPSAWIVIGDPVARAGAQGWQIGPYSDRREDSGWVIGEHRTTRSG